MKTRTILITAILFILSVGNYFRIVDSDSVRNVEFVSIFSMGMLSGILLFQIIKKIKNGADQS